MFINHELTINPVNQLIGKLFLVLLHENLQSWILENFPLFKEFLLFSLLYFSADLGHNYLQV